MGFKPFSGRRKGKPVPEPPPKVKLKDDPFWGPGGLLHNPQWLAIVKRLEMARKDLGWSQADLAVEVMTSQTTIYLWERARTMPKLDRFLAWAIVLGFEPSALLEEVGL